MNAETAPQFTRRHWGRELRGAYLDVTAPWRGASGKLSQFRILMTLLAIFYVSTSKEWTWPGVVAFAALIVALPLDALFARVPIAEALAAGQAVLTAVASQATAKIGGLVSSVSTTKVETERTTTVAPAPSAAPPDDEGDAVG